jgi:MinD-like ATPase involved in chromosome partitioning or flagellar assembly
MMQNGALYRNGALDRNSIISFHSVRRGSGKTTIVANLAALLASQGRRAVVIEADFHSPSLQIFFKLPDWKISHSLNDYVLGQCSIDQAIYDVTPSSFENTGGTEHRSGKLCLAPAVLSRSDAYEKLRSLYTFDCLQEGLNQIIQTYQPDAIFFDNMAGLHEEALLSVASSSSLVMIMQVDPSYFQDTAVAVEIAQKLKVPEIFLVMNNTPASIDMQKAREQMEKTYQRKVLAILPQSIDIAALASSGLLVVDKPQAPILSQLRLILTYLAPS